MSPTFPSNNATIFASLAHWPTAERRELASIQSEPDLELRSEALLGMAARLELAGRLEAAASLYSASAQESLNFESPAGLALHRRAQERLDVIFGRGSSGARAEFLLRNLAQQASDPSMIFAMGAAGAVFRMTRLATLSRLASGPSSNILTHWIGAARLASLTGFALEAPAFTLAARLGGELLGRDQEWSGSALGRDLASSYLVLGGLKLAGWGAGAAHRSVNPRSPWLSTLFQQGGMLTGILLGHSLEEHFGLRSHRDVATNLLDSFATLLQFNVAGRLTRQAFGTRFSAWEEGMELQARQLQSQNMGTDGDGFFGLALSPEFNATTPKTAAATLLSSSGQVFMVGRGRGGDSWRQALAETSQLRRNIAPEDAWRRRAELASDYMARLKDLPTERREVLEEIQQGVEMIGHWSSGTDTFRRAIGFRHYAEIWGLLAKGWNHVALNHTMTDNFQAQLLRHQRILGNEGNPRFLNAAIQASPQLARVYTHSQAALVEASPRERDLAKAFHAVLTTLREGAASPRSMESRKAFLEAFHDSLNNAHGDRLALAEEARLGIRMTRQWLLGSDPERVAIGRRYYPEFWRQLAERAQADFKDRMLSRLQEDIVFLQQHIDPYRTPRETLSATLRAFPYYSEIVYKSADGLVGNTMMSIRLFMQQAGSLRPWILEHSDPEVRAECARCYLKLGEQLQSNAERLPEYAFPFETPLQAQIRVELSEGTEVFAQRLKTQDPQLLLAALKDYQNLVMFLPVSPETSQTLLAESNLKPLMRMQYHPDPRVRPAIEELLIKLLHRFSSSSPRPGPSN